MVSEGATACQSGVVVNVAHTFVSLRLATPSHAPLAHAPLSERGTILSFEWASDCQTALVWRQSWEYARDRKSHTSELQSHSELVCRLLLEKKKDKTVDQLDAQPHT